MCLKTDVHGNPLRRVLLLAMALLWITPLAHGDEVAAWLESRGFTRLLAQHYEDQLPSLRGEDLTEGAQRLARLYAQLLLDAKDRTERTWLEARGQQLLKMIPAGEADDLRVELINGRYMVAEDIAERHRLRLDELGEVGGAIESLTGIIEELELIRSRTAAAVKFSCCTGLNTCSRGHWPIGHGWRTIPQMPLQPKPCSPRFWSSNPATLYRKMYLLIDEVKILLRGRSWAWHFVEA
jgi:hypothetical protein